MAVEVNASLTRNKADAKSSKGISGKLSNSIKALTTNWGLDIPGVCKDQVLIMDEVDGMGGEHSTFLEDIAVLLLPIGHHILSSFLQTFRLF